MSRTFELSAFFEADGDLELARELGVDGIVGLHVDDELALLGVPETVLAVASSLGLGRHHALANRGNARGPI